MQSLIPSSVSELICSGSRCKASSSWSMRPSAKAYTAIRVASNSDGDKRDGLKVLARHLATWVRGSKVRPGKPAGLSAMEHGLACRITQHRKDGLTDEEITRQLSRYKKEDGTSYGIDDVVKLGRLNFTWE